MVLQIRKLAFHFYYDATARCIYIRLPGRRKVTFTGGENFHVQIKEIVTSGARKYGIGRGGGDSRGSAVGWLEFDADRRGGRIDDYGVVTAVGTDGAVV